MDIVVPEKEVLANTLERLRSYGVFCWRNNTGVFRGEHKGKSWQVRASIPGASDILGVLPDGRFLACETKRRGNVPTALQICFMRLVNEKNGVAFWLCDPATVDSILPHVLFAGGRVDMDMRGEMTLEARKR